MQRVTATTIEYEILMHHPHTIVEDLEVIGQYLGANLHRWIEEQGTRLFEERVVVTTGASGTLYRGVMVFELPTVVQAADQRQQ